MSRLLVEATLGVTGIVEALHAEIARLSTVPPTPVHAVVRGVTGVAYAGVRAVTRLVGHGVDAALGSVGATPPAEAAPARDAAVAVLNGILGDHLAATTNPLALPLCVRHDGRVIERGTAPVGAGPRLLVLVHGLCMNHHQWTRAGHDHGAALGRDLGYTVVHVHYNSGQHVSTNGRALADRLLDLVASWPVPLQEMSILAHSMGGLVTRSALHSAAQAGHAWTGALRSVVFLGTPHHGSPLERGGNWIDTVLGASNLTAPLARLGRLRSAGVTDLRHGNLLDEDWQEADRFRRAPDARRVVPLAEGVAWHAVAATTRRRSGGRGRHKGGDGLVPVDSALGRHRDRRRALRIPAARRMVVYGTSHLGLLASEEVYTCVRDWLANASRVSADC